MCYLKNYITKFLFKAKFANPQKFHPSKYSSYAVAIVYIAMLYYEVTIIILKTACCGR